MPERFSRKLVSLETSGTAYIQKRLFFSHDYFIFYHRETQTPPSYPICEAIHNRKVKLEITKAILSLLYFGRRMRAAVVIFSLPGYYSKLTDDLQYCII